LPSETSTDRPFLGGFYFREGKMSMRSPAALIYVRDVLCDPFLMAMDDKCYRCAITLILYSWLEVCASAWNI